MGLNMLDRLRLRRHAVSESDLSGYLDGELSVARGQRVEEHLRTCAACQRDVSELRALKQTLSSLPEVPAPRSFALGWEQARRPARLQPVYATARVYPVIRNAAAAVAVLFFALVGADVFISATGQEPGSEEGAMIVESGTQDFEEDGMLAGRGPEGESPDEQKGIAPAPAEEVSPPPAALLGAEATEVAERQAKAEGAETAEEGDGGGWLRVLEGALAGVAIALVIAAFLIRGRRFA